MKKSAISISLVFIFIILFLGCSKNEDVTGPEDNSGGISLKLNWPAEILGIDENGNISEDPCDVIETINIIILRNQIPIQDKIGILCTKRSAEFKSLQPDNYDVDVIGIDNRGYIVAYGYGSALVVAGKTETVPIDLDVYMGDPDINVEPMAIDFYLQSDQTDHATLHIENIGGSPLSVDEINPFNAPFITSITPQNFVLDPGNSRDVTVNVLAPSAPGENFGEIRILSTDPDDDPLVISVYLEVAEGGQEIELSHDIGDPLIGYTYHNQGYGMANRFFVDGGTKLLRAKYNLYNIIGGGTFLASIWQIDGQQVNRIAFKEYTAANTGWVEVDFAADDVYISGDFFVMIQYNGSDTPEIAANDENTGDGHSWDYTYHDGEWYFDEWIYNTYFIRAIVQLPGQGSRIIELGSEESISPFSNNISSKGKINPN